MKRHRWGDKIEFPLAHKSERECLNGCGICKVTRHENTQHWVEFYRDGERIECTKTPICEAIKAKT